MKHTWNTHRNETLYRNAFSHGNTGENSVNTCTWNIIIKLCFKSMIRCAAMRYAVVGYKNKLTYYIRKCIAKRIHTKWKKKKITQHFCANIRIPCNNLLWVFQRSNSVARQWHGCYLEKNRFNCLNRNGWDDARSCLRSQCEFRGRKERSRNKEWARENIRLNAHWRMMQFNWGTNGNTPAERKYLLPTTVIESFQ